MVDFVDSDLNSFDSDLLLVTWVLAEQNESLRDGFGWGGVLTCR